MPRDNTFIRIINGRRLDIRTRHFALRHGRILAQRVLTEGEQHIARRDTPWMRMKLFRRGATANLLRYYYPSLSEDAINKMAAYSYAHRTPS